MHISVYSIRGPVYSIRGQSPLLVMQYIGRQYVPYINNTYGSSGSIWEGRYKSNIIHDEAYLLTCILILSLTR